MPRRKVAVGRIPVSKMCEIAGADGALHLQWIGAGLIEKCAAEGCDEEDAVQLTVLRALMDVLGAEEARIAWVNRDKEVFRALRGESLDVIYDPRFKTLSVARSDAELVQQVRRRRPIRVLPVADELTEVLAAFDRLVTASKTARVSESSAI